MAKERSDCDAAAAREDNACGHGRQALAVAWLRDPKGRITAATMSAQAVIMWYDRVDYGDH